MCDLEHKKVIINVWQHCISVMQAESLKLGFFTPNKLCSGRTVNRSEMPNFSYTRTVVFNIRPTKTVYKMRDRKNKNNMTDRVSIGNSTRTSTKVLRSKLRWTLTAEQFNAVQQLYSDRTTDQKEERKSPRFAFLKISTIAHCTHLQSRSSQPAGQALQKSAILPTLIN